MGLVSFCVIIEKRFTSAPEIYSIVTSLVLAHRESLALKLTVENYSEVIKVKAER